MIGVPTEVEGVPPTTTAMIAILEAGHKRAAGAESATIEIEETVTLMMAAEIYATIATDPIEIIFVASQTPVRQTRPSRHHSPARYRPLPSPHPPRHLAPSQTGDRYLLTAPANCRLCRGRTATARPPQVTWDPTVLP